MENILIKDKDISDLSWFKTKAKSKYYFEVNSLDDVLKLKQIINFAKENSLKILFIWAWTNLLFAFDVFEGVVIKNNLKWFKYEKNSKILQTYSWELIWDIAEILERDYNQNLWHRFIWLPWSVWWAIFWNAWCFWLEIENNFLDAEVFNLKTWKIDILSKEDSEFSYRNSIFKKTWEFFIIKARFDLSSLREKYSSDVDNIKFRQEFQPMWNSCWSFFKNISKELPAWKLIEEVWLKWFHYKNAYFSEKHANFLMTDKDNWDYRDLLYLIDLAKTKVKEKFNINIQEEVRVISN